MSGTSKDATHYMEGAMQAVEVCQALMTKEQFDGFLLGNIIKYRMRAKYKGKYDEDIRKSEQYNYWRKLAKQDKIINPKEDSIGGDYMYDGI